MATTSNHVTAADHDFTIYKGDTWNVQLTFTDDNSDPVDLSGAALKIQVKSTKGSSTSVLELTEGSGITVSGAGSNIVTINTVADISKGNYYYDLEATYSPTNIITFLKGKVIVVEDVTRA